MTFVHTDKFYGATAEWHAHHVTQPPLRVKLTREQIAERIAAPRPPPKPAQVRYAEALLANDFYACRKIEGEFGLRCYPAETVLAMLTLM